GVGLVLEPDERTPLRPRGDVTCLPGAERPALPGAGEPRDRHEGQLRQAHPRRDPHVGVVAPVARPGQLGPRRLRQPEEGRAVPGIEPQFEAHAVRRAAVTLVAPVGPGEGIEHSVDVQEDQRRPHTRTVRHGAPAVEGTFCSPRARERPMSPGARRVGRRRRGAPMTHELTLMAVHAHPDDEVMGTGGLLARCAAEGIRTVLVTCTNGEQGDGPGGVKPGEPGHDAAEVAGRRLAELRESAELLDVAHLELLGYRDSGMDGWSANDHPEAFANIPLDESAGRLTALMERYRPQVVVTYDENGGYGHPDHIQAHRIAMAAAER